MKRDGFVREWHWAGPDAAENGVGATPLVEAIAVNSSVVADLLISAGADVDLARWKIRELEDLVAADLQPPRATPEGVALPREVERILLESGCTG